MKDFSTPLKFKLNDEDAEICLVRAYNGIDVCLVGSSRPYICRINPDGTLTLYADVDERLEIQDDIPHYIKVKGEFDNGDY